MKKSKLVIEYEFDFDVFGITSSAKGYKLAWEINNRMGVQLAKQTDLQVGFKNNIERSFSHYSYETKTTWIKLLRNKPVEGESAKYFLIPEFPHIDFIILARLNEPQMSKDKLTEMLKLIQSIEFVVFIPLDTLKSKSNFVF